MNLDALRNLIVGGQLLSAERLGEFVTSWQDGGRSAEEGTEFVQWLVELRELTEFQGEALLAGFAGPYLLGPYRVTGHIAAGRLGDVYHAEQIEFNQPVSLKIFPSSLSKDPELTARLGREARVSLQVDSPYVVKTYQVGRVGQIPFIALESLQGETLQQRLEREGRLPYLEACQLIQQAATGLAYIHSQEIIHRDICPASLWVTTQGLVKIMEFGAARDALSYIDSVSGEDDLTYNQTPDEVLGHYAYMSAQQAENPHAADVSSDLYSLGCTFYHLLTGQVPFDEKNPVRQMLRHASEPPRPLSDFDSSIPPIVQDVVSYLLAKRPEDRYGSAEELASVLATIIPLAAIPEGPAVAPDFLEWVTSVDDGDFGVTVHEPEDPDLQQFVSWLSDHNETGLSP